MEIEQLNTRVSKELKKQLKLIAVREGRELEEIINEQLEEYVKAHGDGNPVYTLDKFQDPDFRISPALFSSFDKISNYYSKISEKEIAELDRQLNVWIKVHNKRYKEIR